MEAALEARDEFNESRDDVSKFLDESLNRLDPGVAAEEEEDDVDDDVIAATAAALAASIRRMFETEKEFDLKLLKDVGRKFPADDVDLEGIEWAGDELIGVRLGESELVSLPESLSL